MRNARSPSRGTERAWWLGEREDELVRMSPDSLNFGKEEVCVG
jgi:hypothetical protein